MLGEASTSSKHVSEESTCGTAKKGEDACSFVAFVFYRKFGYFVGTKNNSNLNISSLTTEWIAEHFKPKFTEVPVCEETTIKQLSFHLLSHHKISPTILCHTDDPLSVSYMTIYFHTQYCRSQLRPALTWHQAAELCEISHGTLPVFRSGQELEEFVAVLKLTVYFRRNRVFNERFLDEALKNPLKDPFFFLMNPYMERDDFDIHFMSLAQRFNWKTTRKQGLPSPEQYRLIYLGLMSNPKVKVSSVLMLCHGVLPVNFLCSDIVVEANNPQTFFSGCQEF